MDNQVAQLKLFLESIADYDEPLVSKVQDAVSVIFEGEENSNGYSDSDMKLYNKVKSLVAGGFEDLPKDVKEKVAKRKGVSVADIDKAVKMFTKLNNDETIAEKAGKKLNKKS